MFQVLIFDLVHCHYRRAAPLLFHKLQNDVYEIDEESYQKEFTQPLQLVSGLGFSGSIFFYTHDKSYIVKSIGRRFEVLYKLSVLVGYDLCAN